MFSFSKHRGSVLKIFWTNKRSQICMEIINETMNIFILHSYISLSLCSLLCHIKFQLSFDKPFHDKPSQFCSELVLHLDQINIQEYCLGMWIHKRSKLFLLNQWRSNITQFLSYLILILISLIGLWSKSIDKGRSFKDL